MSLSDPPRRALLGLLSPAGPRARLLILTFHQVLAEPDPLHRSTPHVRAFAEQMQWLKDYCTVLPLPEAADGLREGRLPARAACITFDDGYSDNHDNAAPVLGSLGLPATFFVTGGAAEDGIMWNDLVIEGVRRAGGALDLGDLDLGSHRLGGDGERRAAIPAIIDKLKYRPLDERRAIAETVFSRAAGTPPPRLMMTRDQVASLAGRHFDVGAHTIHHPILKELSDGQARQEITDSRNWVRDVTGVAPRSFAYPNGRPGIDFTTGHEAMVREAGFSVAVSTRWAAATRGDSLFALPRFAPWERARSGYWSRLAKTLIRSYVGGD
ncbi:MAG TPA: polysaccharide deacetylase family protein [Woeseiaceae bacterium]|nr:polysaccharide deacetylase family protein [Woeseiaceae bacterium]